MNWKALPIVLIDTETTGLQWTRHRVLECAAIRFRLTEDPLEPEFMESFSSIICPGAEDLEGEDAREALEVNGISRAEIEAAPSFLEIAPRLDSFVGGTGPGGCWKGYAVAAYHASFDHRMLAAEWLRAGLDLPDWLHGIDPRESNADWIDPLVWCREALPRAKGGHSLDRQRERLGLVPEGQAHRALTDVMDAARVLNWLASGGSRVLAGHGDLAELLVTQDLLEREQRLDLLRWLRGRKG